LENQKKPSQLGSLIIFIRVKMTHKGENEGVKMLKYYFCNGTKDSDMLSNSFKWKHFVGEIILLNVRWYLKYPLSYRNLEEMMTERGVKVDHTTIMRWVHQYSPEIEKKVRRYLGIPQK
jgi:hypothetical protein